MITKKLMGLLAAASLALPLLATTPATTSGLQARWIGFPVQAAIGSEVSGTLEISENGQPYSGPVGIETSWVNSVQWAFGGNPLTSTSQDADAAANATMAGGQSPAGDRDG